MNIISAPLAPAIDPKWFRKRAHFGGRIPAAKMRPGLALKVAPESALSCFAVASRAVFLGERMGFGQALPITALSFKCREPREV